MVTIEAHRSFTSPPPWAVQQRQLLTLLGEAIDPIVEEYLGEDGRPLWPPDDEYVGIDGHDDLYEGFYNWPLVYAMGGDEKLLREAKQGWEAIVDWCGQIATPFGHPMVVDEYEQCRDWFHQGEANLLLYNIGLADPYDDTFADRAERFAALYLPDGPVDNYDGDRNLVRAPQTGSMGPEYCTFAEFDEQTADRTPTLDVPSYGAALRWEDYGLPFQDLPGIETIEDLKDPENTAHVVDIFDKRCSKGDMPSNLAITSLMTHAYLYSGDDRYRTWVTEYVTAWLERIESNDGIIPDNVGRSGEIGEYLDGKWYGGFKGWTWSGWHSFGGALAIGAENATMLEGGEPAYLELIRSQLEVLMDAGIAVSSDNVHDTLYIPHRYGDPGDYHYKARGSPLREDDGEVFWRNGWYEFKPSGDAPYPMHLWYASMDAADRERFRRLRHYGRKDWRTVDHRPPGKHAQHDASWLAYLDGTFPAYPERVLAATFTQVQDRLEQLRIESNEAPDTYDAELPRDYRKPPSFDEDYLRHRNPVSEEALLQLTMGAPNQIYYGGLLMARIRHFDAKRRRPGLPTGVGALVSDLDAESLTVTIVNTSGEHQSLVMQGGAYGEHVFTRVADEDGQICNGEEAIVRISLPAGTHITLEAEQDRFGRTPRYAFPWDRTD